MNNANAVWLVIVLAVTAANLPFLNNRWLGVLPRGGATEKGLVLRLLELVLFYFVVGGAGLVLENPLPFRLVLPAPRHLLCPNLRKLHPLIHSRRHSALPVPPA